ncbi:hypothetical protein J1N35_013436 [Gossypium stocksii]|uniref:Reverse transcriptase domain-containing protein n=1 Tax=Gossypium stocksii TaxID=47602 RepID=A0A9D4A7V1_9ROSI|nr:hypothetical protein J1N35_013436 [Gossypium stocksii]
MAALIDAKIQLNFDIEKDECYWKQRARVDWLKFGDKNTAYFHSQAIQRRRRNLIRKLKDDEGRKTKIIQEMETIARSYFQNLFMSKPRGSVDHVLSGINRCISEDDNRKLTVPFTKEEVKSATLAIGPTKAPGEDGLPAIFY